VRHRHRQRAAGIRSGSLRGAVPLLVAGSWAPAHHRQALHLMRRRPVPPAQSFGKFARPVRDTATATIKVVYLARLREVLGVAAEEVEPPPGLGSVGALRAWLAARGGAWATELAPGRAVRIAVNHDL